MMKAKGESFPALCVTSPIVYRQELSDDMGWGKGVWT